MGEEKKVSAKMAFCHLQVSGTGIHFFSNFFSLIMTIN